MPDLTRAELSMDDRDPIIRRLHQIIRLGVKILAVLMTLLILWGIGDVIWIMVQRLREPPFLILKIGDILATFGGFLAVLIAIEIFLNITLYLRDDVIQVRLVIATALMAIALKVIVFDFKENRVSVYICHSNRCIGLGCYLLAPLKKITRVN